MNVGRCKKCGASVLWSKTTKGIPIPLDPIPLHVAMGDPDEEISVRVARSIHIATCPKRNVKETKNANSSPH